MAFEPPMQCRHFLCQPSLGDLSTAATRSRFPSRPRGHGRQRARRRVWCRNPTMILARPIIALHHRLRSASAAPRHSPRSRPRASGKKETWSSGQASKTSPCGAAVELEPGARLFRASRHGSRVDDAPRKETRVLFWASNRKVKSHCCESGSHATVQASTHG